MTCAGGLNAPASSRRAAPHGWVWRFRICALGRPDRRGARRWLRFEIDVAGPYAAASRVAKYAAVWRGGSRPLVLGVRRLRPAGPEREQGAIDARF